jgi:hypothetical protein
MISPYQVSPPQGNLLGSILDFIGQNRQLQLDAGTRNQINGEQGFGPNVDPFAVQKYQGEGQRQTIAGDMNNRAAQDQRWQGDDRTSQQNTLGALSQNPVISQDPVLGSLVGNGGSNAMIGQAIMSMLGNDRSSENQMQNWGNQFSVENAAQLARDAMNNNYELGQINAAGQMRGASAGGKPVIDPRVEAAKKRYIETGDRQELLTLGAYDEQVEQGRQDFLYNTQKQNEQQAAQALLQQRNGAKPAEAVQKQQTPGAISFGQNDMGDPRTANIVKDIKRVIGALFPPPEAY